MPYLNIDDHYPEHPKIDALSDGAFRLHVAAMAYCAKELSDGTVPMSKVRRLTPNYRPAHLSELIVSRRFHRGGEGCGTDYCPIGTSGEVVVHDYLEWNKSKQWWEDKRAADAKRLKRWRDEQAAKEAGERRV